MSDDELSPDERDAMASLARGAALPAHLEARAVEVLRAAGHLPRPGRRWTSRLAQAAAVAVVFAAGFGAAHLPFGRGDTRDEYLLLLYGGSTYNEAAEMARVEEYSAWAAEEARAGRLLDAERLGDAVKVVGGQRAGAMEFEPSGYFLIRASSTEEAATVAARCPHVRHGGTVVVRPIVRAQ